jgi:hypothetical protein
MSGDNQKKGKTTIAVSQETKARFDAYKSRLIGQRQNLNVSSDAIINEFLEEAERKEKGKRQ